MEIDVDERVGRAYFGRGLVDHELAELNAGVIDTARLQRDLMSLSPSLLATQFPPIGLTSSIPNAAVCLEDMALTLGEAEYALRQAMLALHVFRNHNPVEPMAVSMAKFYVSDLAMRLYAAGEHAAAAILDILGRSEKELEREKQISRQSKVAAFLKREMATHPLTTIGRILGECPEFFSTLDFRAKLTHHQPPTVAGIGMVHRRQASRWKRKEEKSAKGTTVWQLRVGGGDPPETTVDQILRNAERGFSCFCEYAELLVDHYFEVLRSHGIELERAKSET
jgi:hypothetical protein